MKNGNGEEYYEQWELGAEEFGWGVIKNGSSE